MTVINWLIGLLIGVVLSGVQAAPLAHAPAERFDYLVRADFFAGVAGNEARLKKAIDLCEQTLADNPKHAEAMVWHGAATLVLAGQAFQKGDMATGGPLFERGLKEMNDAVALAPDNPGVLIPRAAVLFEATRNMPPDMARPLLESAVQNYERVLEIQSPSFATLGDHAKGELLFGLAEGSARLGQADKARAYFDRLISDAPTSGQTPKGEGVDRNRHAAQVERDELRGLPQMRTRSENVRYWGRIIGANVIASLLVVVVFSGASTANPDSRNCWRRSSPRCVFELHRTAASASRCRGWRHGSGAGCGFPSTGSPIVGVMITLAVDRQRRRDRHPDRDRVSAGVAVRSTGSAAA